MSISPPSPQNITSHTINIHLYPKLQYLYVQHVLYYTNCCGNGNVAPPAKEKTTTTEIGANDDTTHNGVIFQFPCIESSRWCRFSDSNGDWRVKQRDLLEELNRKRGGSSEVSNQRKISTLSTATERQNVTAMDAAALSTTTSTASQLQSEATQSSSPPRNLPPITCKQINPAKSLEFKLYPGPVYLEYLVKMVPSVEAETKSMALNIPVCMKQLPICRNRQMRIWVLAEELQHHAVELYRVPDMERITDIQTSKSKEWNLMGMDSKACRSLDVVQLRVKPMPSGLQTAPRDPLVHQHDNYFTISIFDPPHETVEAIEPQKVLVFWDASGSHYGRERSRNISLLSKLTLYWIENKLRKHLELVVVPFDRRKRRAKRFLFETKDQVGELKNYLQSIQYTGMICLDCLFNIPTPLERNTDFCVLFSDGIENSFSTRKSSIITRMDDFHCPIFCIPTQEDASCHCEKLRHIATGTGGLFLPHDTPETDMISTVGKPVFSLRSISYDKQCVEEIYPSKTLPVSPHQPIHIVGKLHNAGKEDSMESSTTSIELQFGFPPRIVTDRMKFTLQRQPNSQKSLHDTDYRSYFSSYVEFSQQQNTDQHQVEDSPRNFIPCMLADYLLSQMECFPIHYKKDIALLSERYNVESLHTAFSLCDGVNPHHQKEEDQQFMTQLKDEWRDVVEWYNAQMRSTSDSCSFSRRFVNWIQRRVLPTLHSVFTHTQINTLSYFDFDFDHYYNNSMSRSLKDAYPVFAISKSTEEMVRQWMKYPPQVSEILSRFTPWNESSALQTFEMLKQGHERNNNCIHPMLFSEVGHLFIRKGLVSEGLQILQTLLRIFPASHALFPNVARCVALAHLYHGDAELACDIFLHILQSYPVENPVLLLELSHCYEERSGDFLEETIHTLVKIIGTEWTEEYHSVQLTALRELNRLLFQRAADISEEQVSSLDPSLLEHTPCDLRVLASSDIDPSHDFMLQIVESDGTIVSLERPYSESTGAILCGQEVQEYLLPRSLHSSLVSSTGIFRVEFSSQQQAGTGDLYNLLGTPRIYYREYGNFQRKNESVSCKMVSCDRRATLGNPWMLLSQISLEANRDLMTLSIPQTASKKMGESSRGSNESSVCLIS